MVLGLSLIVSGVIVGMIGFVIWYYGGVFSKELTKCEAVVTAKKRMTSRPYDLLVCPEAEYSINGRFVRGHYYTHLPESVLNANIGDTIVVEVNPAHPKVFRISAVEETRPMQNTKKNAWVCMVLGAVFIVSGIICIIIARTA